MAGGRAKPTRKRQRSLGDITRADEPEAKRVDAEVAEAARLKAKVRMLAEAAASVRQELPTQAAVAEEKAVAVTAAAAAVEVEVEQQQQQVAAAKADADAEAAAVIAAQEQAAEQAAAATAAQEALAMAQAAEAKMAAEAAAEVARLEAETVAAAKVEAEAAAATAAQEALAMAQAAEAKMAADAAAENMDDAHAEEEELVVADADTKTAKKTDSNQSRIPRLRSLHELKTRQWHRRVAAAAMQHETGGALAAPIAATTGVGSRTQTDTLSGDEKLSAAGETMQAPGRWVLNVSAARGGTKCMLSLLAEEQGWCCSTAAGRGSIFWTVTTDETDAVLAVKHPNQRVSRIPGCFEL